MANHTKTPLEQLKEFLNKIFQFERQDLDFGVYRILAYKRKEIRKFIDELLVDKVKSELQALTGEEVGQAKKELQNMEESSAISKWLSAKANREQDRIKFYEEEFSKEINEYKELKAKAENAKVSFETENQIYNHLTTFFSRYYDKGDFISKRRFGKNEKYVVPYNGEETHFYWANHDQYYIKSSETFNQYSFRSPKPSDPLKVHFKLTEAQVEQGNVKEDETKYFVLSEKEPVLENNELSIFFEYRPLTEEEKKQAGTQNKQDNLNLITEGKLQKMLENKPETAALWEKSDEETFLLKKLKHYTRKNNYDFFIHKNLKGFLQRELDFYIKSELVGVDDLYVQETLAHFERIKHNLKTIKVFKNIADTIIDFLAQIEEFQKKLWEKKKFVLNTEWVITIDKLVGLIGEEKAEPVLSEVLNSGEQINEWKELFGEEIFEDWDKIELKDLYSISGQGELGKDDNESKIWKKLPIDTAHFSSEFKYELLNLLSEKIDIEENADGLVIHSDNYHGLKLLHEKFNNKIDAIYIDPPYNAKSSEILYKNNFKHSSFMSLLEPRIGLSKKLMSEGAIHSFSIDDYELRNLLKLLERLFSENNRLGSCTVVHNPGGRQDDKFFPTAHEYLLFFTNNIYSAKISRLHITESKMNEYRYEDKYGKYKLRGFRRSGSNSNREDGLGLWYPIYIDTKTLFPYLEPGQNRIEKYPIDNNNVKKCWRWGQETFRKKREKYIDVFEKNGVYELFVKERESDNEGEKAKTIWNKKKYASVNGTNYLKKLFGENNNLFDYPKSPDLIFDTLKISSNQNKSIILDYFGGAGTTFNAVQLLNNYEPLNRFSILLEQGEYVYTTILPRIKKIAYTFDWKDGKPKNGSMNGLGVFFKYQKLEQYEEALENISFNLSEEAEQRALKFDQYIPKYFLEFETKNSKTLVNTAAMENPWDYKLKVWDGYTYDNQEAVDLVETFNYLIGLHLNKLITKEIDGTKYRLVYGHNNDNKKILVVWRSIKNWQKEDYEKDRAVLTEELKKYQYDHLYINGQAHWEKYQPIEQLFKNKMVN